MPTGRRWTHRTAYENQEKAIERDTVCELIESTGLVAKTRRLINVIKQFVEMCAILLEIKMEPLQAACQAVKLHRMTAATGEDPVEMVGKYLDYFVRVRESSPSRLSLTRPSHKLKSVTLEMERKSREFGFCANLRRNGRDARRTASPWRS